MIAFDGDVAAAFVKYFDVVAAAVAAAVEKVTLLSAALCYTDQQRHYQVLEC